MVDDTVTISKCGNTSMEPNSTMNSFIETNRLTLSQDTSVVIHVGRKHTCKLPCPKLKVHESTMKESDSSKYLGTIVSSMGGVKETLEDRRNKGWGKVASILGILAQVDMGSTCARATVEEGHPH